MQRLWLMVVTLVVIAGMVMACAGTPTPAAPAPSDSTSGETTEETPAEPVVEPTQDSAGEEPAATEEASTGTDERIVLTISDEQKPVWVRNFNPFAPDPLNTALNMLFEPLLIFNIATGETVPWLATEYTYDESLESLTFTLREGVMWSDGEDFTADDVIFTYEMLREFPALDKGAVWEILDSVEKVDDYTVTFNLNKVYGLAHERLGAQNVVPEHQWSEVEDPVTFTNENPVGTGPFTEITDFQDQVYFQCKNPNYWQEGKPTFDCLRVPANPGNEQSIAAMMADEVDWAGHFVPDIDETYVAADPEHHHYYFAPNDTISIYMNTTKAPFDDVNFRRAVSMALDREEMVAIGMYGYATLNDNPGGLSTNYTDWYNADAIADAAPLGTFAPEEAEALLEEAGYTDQDGDGWRDLPDGSPLTFKVQVVNGWTDWVTSVQIATENLQDVGLNAEVETLEFGAWFDNLQKATYDTSIGWSTVNPTPWNFYQQTISSAMIVEDVAQGMSWSRWNSAETDELIDAFVATTDEAEQREIINELQAAVIENVPFTPLFANPGWYEYNTLRFTGFPNAENNYARGMPFESIAERLILVTTIEPVQ